MARRRSNRKGRGQKVCDIVVDGETEIWYLQMLRKVEGMKHLQIRPELPKKKKLRETFDYVCEISRDYDHVIWIADFDTIITEGKASKGGLKGMMQVIEQYISKIKESPNIKLIFNTPCLEQWFLIHFEFSTKYHQNCNSVIQHLKKNYLYDYEKSERFFKKTHQDIYSRLKPNLKNAITNSKRLGNVDCYKPESTKAEMYKLFEFLGITD